MIIHDAWWHHTCNDKVKGQKITSDIKTTVYDECQCLFYDQTDPQLAFFSSYWDRRNFSSGMYLCYCIVLHCPHSPHCPLLIETRLAILVKTACKTSELILVDLWAACNATNRIIFEPAHVLYTKSQELPMGRRFRTLMWNLNSFILRFLLGKVIYWFNDLFIVSIYVMLQLNSFRFLVLGAENFFFYFLNKMYQFIFFYLVCFWKVNELNLNLNLNLLIN